MTEIRLARTAPGEDPSTAARRLLTSALETEYGIPASAFQVEKDEKGKPYLTGYPHIHISISHSGPYIACAFGEKPVGVDVEMWKAHPKWRRIVDKLHPREREELLQSCGGVISGDTEEPVREFCGLWVRKESFLKAIGEGLRVPLALFDTTGDWVEQELSPERWRLWQYEPEEGCSLAVCMVGDDGTEPHLQLDLFSGV